MIYCIFIPLLAQVSSKPSKKFAFLKLISPLMTAVAWIDIALLFILSEKNHLRIILQEVTIARTCWIVGFILSELKPILLLQHESKLNHIQVMAERKPKYLTTHLEPCVPAHSHICKCGSSGIFQELLIRCVDLCSKY